MAGRMLSFEAVTPVAGPANGQSTTDVAAVGGVWGKHYGGMCPLGVVDTWWRICLQLLNILGASEPSSGSSGSGAVAF